MTFSLDDLVDEKRRSYRRNRRSLIEAVRNSRNAIIAEIKRKSPSEGMIWEVDVAEAAKSMEKGGACAISVLTEGKHFGGSLDDLRKARESVGIPVMRKDFIVDDVQLCESLVFGADAVLLIAAVLKDSTKYFVKRAHALGLETLVEIHDGDDLGFAIDSGSKLIGINNRDLKTLEIDLGTTEMLAPMVPDDRLVVSESGVRNAEDARRLFGHGADALLVGTSIMKSGDIERKVRELAR